MAAAAPHPLPPACPLAARAVPPQGLKVAIVEGHDIGGTCVNRGCVPSKALLAASNEVRKLRNDHHLKTLGIQLQGATPSFDRQAIADHATNLATTVQGNLQRSLESLGVVRGRGRPGGGLGVGERSCAARGGRAGLPGCSRRTAQAALR